MEGVKTAGMQLEQDKGRFSGEGAECLHTVILTPVEVMTHQGGRKKKYRLFIIG